MHKVPISPKVNGLWHGGDYNPEQWPKETWAEDQRLMDLANMNFATIGVFSWVSLEPNEGVYTWDWLDEIMDSLAAHGRAAILATPSAAPPAWLSQKYPETLRTGADGVRRRHGNRVNYNWASPVYREKSQAMARMLAERYGDHPALAMWHLSNEYGGEDYSALSADAFRNWLSAKFEGDLDRLNVAYWTAFWGHTYTDWSQIEIPGQPYGESSIDGLTLDWKRFCAWQMADFFRFESAPMRELTPEIPITTNLMGFYDALDPWLFADDMDVATWDNYPYFAYPPSNPEAWVLGSMAHDLSRSLKGGKPFLMIESTPSSSNWMPVQGLKRPQIHLSEGLQAVAHGSDGVGYFQFRASRSSQERFHGAVVGHGGQEETRVFREVAEVGRALKALSPVAGETRSCEVALLFDWDSRWALEASAGPRLKGVRSAEILAAFYRPFWELAIGTDILDSSCPFDGYRVLVAPALFLLKPGVAERLVQFVEAGGTFVTTYLSGIVDDNNLVYERAKNWPLRRLLGHFPEEIDALYDDQFVTVKWADKAYKARILADLVNLDPGAEAVATYVSDFYAGRAAVVKNRFGAGTAWTVCSINDAEFQNDFVDSLATELSLHRALPSLPAGVTAQVRGDLTFVLNATPQAQTVPLPYVAIDAVSGEEFAAQLPLAPNQCRAVRRE